MVKLNAAQGQAMFHVIDTPNPPLQHCQYYHIPRFSLQEGALNIIVLKSKNIAALLLPYTLPSKTSSNILSNIFSVISLEIF